MGKIDYSIIGKRFGLLEVVSLSHSTKKATYWICKCDCGNEKVIIRGGLTSGDYISCGCYHKSHIHEYGFKHGKSHTKLYSKWSSMIQRTSNVNNQRYVSYGLRGILVCDEWKEFLNFMNWATENGYQDGLSLERIDVNGNYEPKNCKWIELKDQYENKQNSNLITYNHKTQSLSRWARELNVNRETLRYRVNHFGVELGFHKSLQYTQRN